MNEVEKMYSNANIKICKRKQGFTLKDCTDRDCQECGYYDMPPFTAEKQIELIKWLAINKEDFGIHYRDYDEECRWVCGCEFNVEDYLRFNEDRTFEEALARLINNLWQNLTEEEKQQIKEILE